MKVWNIVNIIFVYMRIHLLTEWGYYKELFIYITHNKIIAKSINITNIICVCITHGLFS
jgi:hypothetical protein